MTLASSQYEKDPAPQPAGLATGLTHVAIIMDGNGRWAKERGRPRIEGHRQGAEALRRTLEACAEHGVKWLTVYAFSSENWGRPEQEVNDLMGLLKHYINKEVDSLHKQQIAVRFIGDRSRLSDDIRQMLEKTEEKTIENAKFHLNIALSYGSKQELVHACQQIVHDVKQGKLTAEAITEKTIAEKLYTSGIPEPDLLIRTGGEQRLSNFLLWQMAYTELYFTETLWPDFDAEDIKRAIEAYGKRERRYGKRHTE